MAIVVLLHDGIGGGGGGGNGGGVGGVEGGGDADWSIACWDDKDGDGDDNDMTEGEDGFWSTVFCETGNNICGYWNK